MGRSPCCEKVGLKKGTWTAEEDQKLLSYIERHGHGSWRALPAKAGLQRCGKSCRLRWTNYLRPDIKRGKFSLQEEQTIIQLHALLGNRWSAIATHLARRTDNEIKNYWNTHLKKRLTKMGIDPETHKLKSNTLNFGQPKDTANLNHMAQWESARLEAEVRLVRESKLMMSNNINNPYQTKPTFLPPCLDILKVWQATWTTTKNSSITNPFFVSNGSLQSPTSTLNFSDNILSISRIPSFGKNITFPVVDFVENSKTYTIENIPNHQDYDEHREEVGEGMKMEVMDNAIMQLGQDTTHEYPNHVDSAYVVEDSLRLPSFVEGFACILSDQNLDTTCSGGGGGGGDLEDNGKYWNDILSNAVTFTSGSSIF